MSIFYLEAGTNHFGKQNEALQILNFFLKSNYKNLTFMIQSEEFINKHLQRGIDFRLSKKFYNNALKMCHSKKKKLGLAVCSEKTFKEVYDLNFDFYKLLSLGINNLKLIDMLKKKNKPIFISTGHRASDTDIKKCLKQFNKKVKITLLHSPMTYSPQEIFLSRVIEMRKKFKLKVGYSNHNNDINNIYLLSAYEPDAIFLYCKQRRKKGRVYPDDEHAFYFKELENFMQNYLNYNLMHKKIKKIKQVKIFTDELKA